MIHCKAVAGSICQLCEWSVLISFTIQAEDNWRDCFWKPALIYCVPCIRTNIIHVFPLALCIVIKMCIFILAIFPHTQMFRIYSTAWNMSIVPSLKWIQLFWTVFMSIAVWPLTVTLVPFVSHPHAWGPAATHCLWMQRQCDISQPRCRVAMQGARGRTTRSRRKPGQTPGQRGEDVRRIGAITIWHTNAVYDNVCIVI